MMTQSNVSGHNITAQADNIPNEPYNSVLLTSNNASNYYTDGVLNAALFTTESINMHNNNSNSDLYENFHDCHPNNPLFNCTRLDYVKFILGPQILPLHRVLLITIIYGGIFITGILGNILVCVVIVRHSNMHTATNYYLFSLAMSDLLYLLFGLPAEVFIYWHQYPYLFGLPFCKIRAYISEACTYVSVFTIVAFSVERYLAICHPLHTYAMSGFKRALRIILVLWLVSFFSAIPFGLMTNIIYSSYPLDNTLIPESAFCSMQTPDDVPLFEVSFLIFFFIPMTLIIYFYGRMSAKIRSRTVQKLGVQHGSVYGESRHQQSRKAVIRMLAAVVLTFFVCGLPFHIQRLFFIYGKSYKYYVDVNEWLFSLTGFPYYIACTINPILYNLMSHRYRVAFKEILCGKRKSNLYKNGCVRESFRETTMASSLYNATAYDRSCSIRSRSLQLMNERNLLKSDQLVWQRDFCRTFDKLQGVKDVNAKPTTSLIGTNAVVVCNDNGRTKIFTENEAQTTLLNKNNETCI